MMITNQIFLFYLEIVTGPDLYGLATQQNQQFYVQLGMESKHDNSYTHGMILIAL